MTSSFTRAMARLRVRLDVELERRSKLIGKAMRDPARFLSDARSPAVRRMGELATDWGLLPAVDDLGAESFGPRGLVRGHRDPGAARSAVTEGALRAVEGNVLRGFARTLDGPAELVAAIDDVEIARFFAAQRASHEAERDTFDVCIDFGSATTHVTVRVRCAISGRDLEGSPCRATVPRYEGRLEPSTRGRITGHVRDVSTGHPVHIDVEADARVIAQITVKPPKTRLPGALDRWLSTFVATYPARRSEQTYAVRVRGTERPLFGPARFDASWQPRSARTSPSAPSPVHVIIPVYAGLEISMRCVESVLASKNAITPEITVIYDAGPDPALLEALRARAAQGGLELVENATNLGFVRTCNAGMRMHPGLDVVLLNSDTEVADGWLDRLARAGRSSPDIGTATPFSNAATVCSYPTLGVEAPMAEDLAVLDARFAAVNAGEIVDMPSGHGFCLFLRRALLDTVGLFDEEAFGRGYGEENDLCLRGRVAGFRNVVACDVIVKHVGSVSFGAERDERVRHALAILGRRYPEYGPEVTDFIRRDPLAPARNRVVLETLRAERERAESGCIVMITHHLGGGIEVHTDDLDARLTREGVLVVTLSSHEDGTIRLGTKSRDAVYSESDDLPEVLARDLRTLAPRLLHFHAWLSLPPFVQGLPEAIDVPYDVTLHDFFVACPRVNFVRGDGRYCGEPEVRACELCIALDGPHRAARFFEGKRRSVAAHRAEEAAFLKGARRVFAPSNDTATRTRRALGPIPIDARPHPEASATIRVRTQQGERVRVAVLGGIGLHKGYRPLLAIARHAHTRKLPIDIVVFGTTVDSGALRRLPNVTVTGRYTRDALPGLIERSGCTVAAFLSIWPETFSYTLSEALALGLRPVALDLGAPAERIRALGFGRLVPSDASAAEICDALLAAAREPAKSAFEGPFAQYRSMLRDYYAL